MSPARYARFALFTRPRLFCRVEVARAPWLLEDPALVNWGARWMQRGGRSARRVPDRSKAHKAGRSRSTPSLNSGADVRSLTKSSPIEQSNADRGGRRVRLPDDWLDTPKTPRSPRIPKSTIGVTVTSECRSDHVESALMSATSRLLATHAAEARDCVFGKVRPKHGRRFRPNPRQVVA